MDTERLSLLEDLVEELIKPQPKETLIKEYMSQTGMKYCKDPIERLNLVLKELEFKEEPAEEKKHEK